MQNMSDFCDWYGNFQSRSKRLVDTIHDYALPSQETVTTGWCCNRTFMCVVRTRSMFKHYIRLLTYICKKCAAMTVYSRIMLLYCK